MECCKSPFHLFLYFIFMISVNSQNSAYGASSSACDQCVQSGGNCSFNSQGATICRWEQRIHVEAGSRPPRSTPLPTNAPPLRPPTGAPPLLPPSPLASTPAQKPAQVRTPTSSKPRPSPSPPDSHLKKSHKAVIAASTAGSVIILMIVGVLCFVKGMELRRSTLFTKGETRDDQNVEALVRHYGKYVPTRYTYAEIKKMTGNFNHKLGEGGYGGVYKGELDNGCLVAVKLLKKSEGDGKEFINEIASISETNHVNIVTLIGFCFQGRRRALVYEFVPNGSLDKYMHGQQNALEWGVLLQIAVGIARGLDYLHRGCKTRILHFDIKPQNILLDENFCPRISDFGLARPCLQKESIVTMSIARGTPGYIAPEVFCRGFGGASHKSDVYSYGMLVLDMIGCRKNYNARIQQSTGSSEQYFPHWIYKPFELGEDPELQGISNDEEKHIQRKMAIVSLWCIQTSPSSRPPISRVVEMLEGSLESLQVPPVPSLFSPPRSPDQHSSPHIHNMTL